MGLAASQCRLLLLTARLSDTEYRAQMISQRRMALAMQTEQIAMDYTRKLNNRVLKHVFALDANENNTTIKEDLTYYTLTSNNSAMGGGQFRVVMPDGRIAVPSVEDIPGIIVSTGNNDKKQYNVVTKEMLSNFLNDYTGDKEDISSFLNENMTDADYQNLYNAIKADTLAFNAFKEYVVNNEAAIPVENETGVINVNGTEYMILPALKNTEFFQNALRTGGVYVEQYQKNYAENEGWASYDLIHSQFVEDDLNTEDDAAAAAEYEAKSAMIQSQDKILELELKQVETQHQAAQTEYDSVKKVMDKNIERSFKTFG